MKQLSVTLFMLALGAAACGGSDTPPPKDPSSDAPATMPASPEETPAPPADAPAAAAPAAPAK
ncbi:MAG: hypothetical protein ABI548_15330 [Polyangiaceae bacterium]